MDVDPELREVERLARLLDARWRIPGTPIRFGLDGLLGLIPGVGDLAGLLIGLGIVARAQQLGASQLTVWRMLANLGVDLVVGAIPLVGDVADIAWKANTRNLALLRRELQGRAAGAKDVDFRVRDDG